MKVNFEEPVQSRKKFEEKKLQKMLIKIAQWKENIKH